MLPSIGITPGFAKPLASAIMKLPFKITKLDLSDNGLSDSSGILIAKSIENHIGYIEYLNIMNNRLSPHFFQRFYQKIELGINIVELYLSGNKLGDF